MVQLSWLDSSELSSDSASHGTQCLWFHPQTFSFDKGDDST